MHDYVLDANGSANAVAVKDIHRILAGKWEDGTRPKDIFTLYISKDPSAYVDAIVAGLQSDITRVQSGCAEIASLVSEVSPDLLLPYLDLFLANLAAKEPVLRWEAVCTVGNMAKADKDRKVKSAISSMSAFLSDKSIVLQGHSVRALSKIAAAFPDEAGRIQKTLIASKDKFPGNRVGFIIDAMEVFKGRRETVSAAVEFVKPYTLSEISSVATKARRVLKKLAAE